MLIFFLYGRNVNYSRTPEKFQGKRVLVVGTGPTVHKYCIINLLCCFCNNIHVLKRTNYQHLIIYPSLYYTQIQLYSLLKKKCTCLGESGSDIINEISKYASKCAIAIRGKHGHLIPRIQGNGRVTDLNTNRCRYSNPYVFGDWIGYVNQMAKKVLSTFAPDSDQKKV
jgi:hypothetical protein